MAETLDSRQLRAFAAVAERCSFTEAARELHLSQSAISHSIKALEQDVRCRLLDRMGKKVILTQAGEQLFEQARKILELMNATREQMAQLGKWGQGRLRLAASPTVCQYILPTVLREFKESFPQCAIQIEPGDTAKCLDALRCYRVDLAICTEVEPMEAQFEFRPLFADDLQFLVSAPHPWARAGRVERGEIVRQNFILYTKTSHMFDLIQEYFRRERIVLPTSIELGSIEAIKELVKIGVGVSILAPWIAREEIEERSLVALPLGKRKLPRRWGILHWRAQRLSLMEETFAGLCKTAVADL